jgi:uncharacterized protein YbjT (DUF2867 family)
MFVVAGVTGHTGRAAAERLLELGKPVRVIVRKPAQGRDWAGKGADVAVASLDDANATSAALKGAEGAYLLLPPQYTVDRMIEVQSRIADAIAEAVKSSGVGRVVFLSSQGAQRPSGTGPVVALHRAEDRLEATGAPVTFLRAPYFYENWAAVIPMAREQGVLPSFLPADFRMVTAGAGDIGRIAAEQLLRPHTGVRVVEIEGPAPLTPREIARALSSRLKRDVNVVEAPLDAVVPTFTSAGASTDAATSFREMYQAFIEGRMEPLGPPLERVRGTTSIADALLG